MTLTLFFQTKTKQISHLVTKSEFLHFQKHVIKLDGGAVVGGMRGIWHCSHPHRAALWHRAGRSGSPNLAGSEQIGALARKRRRIIAARVAVRTSRVKQRGSGQREQRGVACLVRPFVVDSDDQRVRAVDAKPRSVHCQTRP